MDTLVREPVTGGAQPRRPWLRIIGVVCVVALLVAGGWYAWARAHATPQVYGGAATANDTLRQVTIDSSGGVWAVGARYDAKTSALQDTFILHRQSGQWVVSDMLDATTDEVIMGIAMVSPTEGWAVGEVGGRNALIIRYQNDAWRVLPEHPQGALRAIAMVSPTEGWAVGGGDNGSPSTILRYSNGAWTAVATPAAGPLTAIAMSSADSGWAAGGGILRYANGSWTESAFTPPPDAPISAIVAPSPEEAWAVGDTIYHYDFGKWSVVSAPTGASISGIAMSDPRDGWAVGDPVNTHTSVLWRYGDGAWTAVDSPTQQPLLSVATISPREAWAVGVGGVILHCGSSACDVVNGPA